MGGKGWTVDTLRKHIDRVLCEMEKRNTARFDAIRDHIDHAFESAERAVKIASDASEKRFDSVNEFRAALEDQGRLMMPRTEVEGLIRTQDEKIDELKAQRNMDSGRRVGSSAIFAYIVGAAGIISLIVTIAIRR
jgi:ABC-type transporter Mla subunit MlaD